MLQPKIDTSKTIIGICHMTLTSGKVMYPSWVQFSRRKEPCILMNPVMHNLMGFLYHVTYGLASYTLKMPYIDNVHLLKEFL